MGSRPGPPASTPRWLSADWLSLITALALALLVREGLLPKVPW